MSGQRKNRTVWQRYQKKHESACKQEVGVILGEINFYQMKKISEITAVTKRLYNNWNQAQYEKLLDMFEIDPSKASNSYLRE